MDKKAEARSLAVNLLYKAYKSGKLSPSQLKKAVESMRAGAPVKLPGRARRPAKSTPRGEGQFYGGFADEMRKVK